MLAENCCYWAHILSWREMWGQGLLGDFMYAEAEYIHDTRYLLSQADGSPTWRASMPPIHYCTHSLGPLLKVTGERCVAASGMSVTTGTGDLPVRVKSGTEVAILQTASGGVIKILVAFGITREPMFHYYSIYGTDGVLETSRPPTSPLQTNAWLDSVPHLNNMIEMPDHRKRDRRPARSDARRPRHRRVHDDPGLRRLHPRRYPAPARHPRRAPEWRSPACARMKVP